MCVCVCVCVCVCACACVCALNHNLCLWPIPVTNFRCLASVVHLSLPSNHKLIEVYACLLFCYIIFYKLIPQTKVLCLFENLKTYFSSVSCTVANVAPVSPVRTSVMLLIQGDHSSWLFCDSPWNKTCPELILSLILSPFFIFPTLFCFTDNFLYNGGDSNSAVYGAVNSKDVCKV